MPNQPPKSQDPEGDAQDPRTAPTASKTADDYAAEEPEAEQPKRSLRARRAPSALLVVPWSSQGSSCSSSTVSSPTSDSSYTYTARGSRHVDESGKFGGNAKDRSGERGCRCGRTKCLKQYCACFRNDTRCSLDCLCQDCYNDGTHEVERAQAIRHIRVNHPSAFKGTALELEDQRVLAHDGTLKSIRGCRCKMSKCQKKYCECFGAGLKCSANCVCDNCKNGNEGHGQGILPEALVELSKPCLSKEAAGPRGGGKKAGSKKSPRVAVKPLRHPEAPPTPATAPRPEPTRAKPPSPSSPEPKAKPAARPPPRWSPASGPASAPTPAPVRPVRAPTKRAHPEPEPRCAPPTKRTTPSSKLTYDVTAYGGWGPEEEAPHRPPPLPATATPDLSSPREWAYASNNANTHAYERAHTFDARPHGCPPPAGQGAAHAQGYFYAVPSPCSAAPFPTYQVVRAGDDGCYEALGAGEGTPLGADAFAAHALRWGEAAQGGWGDEEEGEGSDGYEEVYEPPAGARGDSVDRKDSSSSSALACGGGYESLRWAPEPLWSCAREASQGEFAREVSCGDFEALADTQPIDMWM